MYRLKSIYIYKTCWYTSLSTFTLPFPETIKPLTKKQKLFTLLNEDVWKHHMTWATHRPTHKSSFIQNCDARGSNSTQCYILEGGWKSTSVLCTSVLAVRISSFSLECFNTCRSISSHWGNGSNCECLYRKLPLMNLLVHSGGSRSRRSLMNWGLEAYRCFKTIAPLFGITTTNGS